MIYRDYRNYTNYRNYKDYKIIYHILTSLSVIK